MNKIQKNILATISYYDALDFPVTSFEIWKHLINYNHFEEILEENQGISLEKILKELESEKVKRYISSYQGFYFIKGKKELALNRIEKDKISSVKIRKLSKVVQFLRYVPFVRGIFVTGKLAMKNAHPGSDLDVLVILQHGRIWTGRTLITVVTHILGKRRYGNKIKDRVCLNYYISDNFLEIATKDLFSSNEYYFSFPLFDKNVYQKFQMANDWIKKIKPNFYIFRNKNLKEIKDNSVSSKFRFFWEKMIESKRIEKWLSKMEIRRINKNSQTYKLGSMVHVSDKELVFLPNPQGPEIFDKFKKNLEKCF